MARTPARVSLWSQCWRRRRPEQSIDNTLRDNDEFWSSTGSGSCTAGEALLYRVRQPLSRLSYVSVAVYRAHYQHGDPMYPPRKVSFLTGPSPTQLLPASPLYPVRLTDGQQVFALSPTAAASAYLMVRLHGRRQRQWEDLQYYIAIRHVAAYGTPHPPAHVLSLSRAVKAHGLAWPGCRALAAAAAPSAAASIAAAVAAAGAEAATAAPAGAVAAAAGGGGGGWGGRRGGLGGGAGRGGGAGAGAAGGAAGGGGGEDLPRADVYEAGSEPSGAAGTHPSASASGSHPHWWSGLLSRVRPGTAPPAGEAAAAAGSVAAPAGSYPGGTHRAAAAAAAAARAPLHASGGCAWANSISSCGSSSSSSRRGRGGLRPSLAASAAASTSAAAAPAATSAAAAAKASAAAARPRPTGPTDVELRLVAEREALKRAVPHLVHVPWAEVLVVHGGAVQPVVGGGGGDGGGGGGISSRPGGGDAAAAAAAALEAYHEERVRHEQLWMRQAAATVRSGGARPPPPPSGGDGIAISGDGGGGGSGMFGLFRGIFRQGGGAAGGAGERAPAAPSAAPLYNGDASSPRRTLVPDKHGIGAGDMAAASAAAAHAPAAPSAMRQLPQRRRRGAGGEGSADAADAAAAAAMEGAEDRAARRRRRRHERAARRAMRQASYTPGRPLFVALEGWAMAAAGRRGDAGTSRTVSGARRQDVMEVDGGSGGAGAEAEGTGPWLVSHYDNEHLQ